MPKEKQKYFKHLTRKIDKVLREIHFSCEKKENTVLYIFQYPILKTNFLEILAIGKEIERYVEYETTTLSRADKFFLKHFQEMFHDHFYVANADDNFQIKHAVYNDIATLHHSKNQKLQFCNKNRNMV